VTARKSKKPPHPHYELRWEWARFIMTLNGISAAEKVMAQGIAWFINYETGTAWPSQKNVGRRCGVGERQARSTLTAMEEHGLIKDLRPGGGRTSSGVGVTGEYQMLRTDEVRAALELLNGDERGSILPDKPGRTLPGKPGSEETANPEVVDGQPGSDEASTRQCPADNLNRPSVLPTNKPSDEPKVRRASDRKIAWGFVSQAMLKVLCHDIQRDGTWVGSERPDAYVMRQLPPAVLDELIARCQAGTLEVRLVEQAAIDARIPKFSEVLPQLTGGAEPLEISPPQSSPPQEREVV
jgi:hypothetical protein